MPRIYDSASNPIDFCKSCFPKETIAEKLYGNPQKTGLAPDERGNCFSYKEDHPEYDAVDYNCEICNKKLTYRDD